MTMMCPPLISFLDDAEGDIGKQRREDCLNAKDNFLCYAACGISSGMPTSGLCRAVSPPMHSERELAALIVA